MRYDNNRQVSLSYVVNTRNKLPYLRETMPRLLANVGTTEEVVVFDGASTDGSTEYLAELHKAGKIHQFRSHPDKGEAHGWNIGLLMARGELIKLIADDDVYHYPTVQTCKEFMLEHPQFDILWAETVICNIEQPHDIQRLEQMQNAFVGWVTGKHQTIPLNNLSIMVRRNSLSLTGLFHPAFRAAIDFEFSLRIGTVANLCWCPRPMVVSMLNPRSCSRRDRPVWHDHWLRLTQFYGYPLVDLYPVRHPFLHQLTSTFRQLRNTPRRYAARIWRRLKGKPAKTTANGPAGVDIPEAYRICENWLMACPSAEPGEFLYRKRQSQGAEVEVSAVTGGEAANVHAQKVS